MQLGTLRTISHATIGFWVMVQGLGLWSWWGLQALMGQLLLLQHSMPGAESMQRVGPGFSHRRAHIACCHYCIPACPVKLIMQPVDPGYMV